MTKYPAFQSEVLDHQQRSAKGVTPKVLLQVELQKEASRAGLRGETPLCPTLPFPTREPRACFPFLNPREAPRIHVGSLAVSCEGNRSDSDAGEA